MKRHNSGLVYRSFVLFFLAAYFVGSFANMMLIPHYVPEFSTATQNSAIAPNRRPQSCHAHSINFVQIFDKSTIDNDLSVKLLLGPKCIDLIFHGASPIISQDAFTSPKNNPYKSRYAYLSLCTFRI